MVSWRHSKQQGLSEDCHKSFRAKYSSLVLGHQIKTIGSFKGIMSFPASTMLYIIHLILHEDIKKINIAMHFLLTF